MKTCFLFHFVLSSKTVAHILFLAVFSEICLSDHNFRANHGNNKQRIPKNKPAIQPPHFTTPLRKKAHHFPQASWPHVFRNKAHNTRGAHKATADIPDTEVCWYLHHKGVHFFYGRRHLMKWIGL